jgi:zeaxanthin glucosyltransferase
MSTHDHCDSKRARGLNIVVAIHHEEGHCNASFGLARRLRDRGHRVIYLGLMDARKLVIDQGFEFVPFAEDILPEGAVRESADPSLFARFLEALSNGHLDQRLLSCQPDLLLCDTCVWYVAVRALYLGIRTINIAVTLASYPNPHVPPFVSTRIPRASWWGRMQVRADWLRLRCQVVFTKRLASILLGRYRSPSRMHHLTGEFLKLATRSGITCKENRTYWFSEMGPRMILPEIVLPPRSFDFPYPPGMRRRYLGDFVDLGRQEDATLLEQLNPEKPLVYGSLGSVPGYYPHSGRFFRTVVAASRQTKDWQWVLSVGTQAEVDRLRDASPNLVVVKWAPQLSMLRRAAVMVTHGGINSIMECIHFAVPMVIVPGLRDQPGNMARAVHHGIAVTATMKDITAGQLVKMIENAMHNVDLRRALLRMKDRIAAETGMEAAVELIEAGHVGPGVKEASSR